MPYTSVVPEDMIMKLSSAPSSRTRPSQRAVISYCGTPGRQAARSVEIVFDELRKRDYSSWNIVSLLTRAQILSIEEPQLATLMSGAGGSNKAYQSFAQRMERSPLPMCVEARRGHAKPIC